MKQHKHSLLILLLVSLAACGADTPKSADLRIDASSDEAFRASIDAIKASLSTEEKKLFESGLLVINYKTLSEHAPYKILATAQADPDGARRRLRDELNGMAAQEVMKQAKQSGEVRTVPGGDGLESQMTVNETAAIACLKNLYSAQTQCQASGAIDVNGNGAGEYGYFAELSGGVNVRGKDGTRETYRMNPAVLSAAFANVKNGCVARAGYLFQMYLADEKMKAVPEGENGGAGKLAPSARHSEVCWSCYAWPQDHGKSGQRAFFINMYGDVFATKNESVRYSSHANAPHPDAAYCKGQQAFAGNIAFSAQSNDGQVWTLIR